MTTVLKDIGKIQKAANKKDYPSLGKNLGKLIKVIGIEMEFLALSLNCR
jgi:hypothetical protein